MNEGDIFVLGVSKADIEGARTGSPANCPVARALKRKGYTNVGVTADRFRLDRHFRYFILPPAAKRRIFKYDTGSGMTPFTVRFKLVLDENA